MTTQQDEAHATLSYRQARNDLIEQCTGLVEALTYFVYAAIGLIAVVALVLLRFLPWNKLFS